MLSFLLNLIHGVYTQSTLSFVKTNFVVNHRPLCAVFAFEINVTLFASSGTFPFRAVPATAQRELGSLITLQTTVQGGRPACRSCRRVQLEHLWTQLLVRNPSR